MPAALRNSELFGSDRPDQQHVSIWPYTRTLGCGYSHIYLHCGCLLSAPPHSSFRASPAFPPQSHRHLAQRRSLWLNVTQGTRCQTQWPDLDGSTRHSYDSHLRLRRRYASTSPGSEPCRLIMCPNHHSILSLYCINLHMLAVPAPLPTTPKAPFEVPAVRPVPLALPNLDSFPLLTQFLHLNLLKDMQLLFEGFPCLTLAKGTPSDLDQPVRYENLMIRLSLNS